MIRILPNLIGLASLLAPAGLAQTPTGVPLKPAIMQDCNGNGIEDAVDIATGISSDANLNGIPDECEQANLEGSS